MFTLMLTIILHGYPPIMGLGGAMLSFESEQLCEIGRQKIIADHKAINPLTELPYADLVIGTCIRVGG